MVGCITNIKLTPREREIYNVLESIPASPYEIARRAGIRTTSPSETVAKFCISLTKKGLAAKHGSRMFPRWARA